MQLVSVVIPAYNVAEFLGETIESVLAQTYEHFELIIVNDGSTDNTLAVAEQYAARDERIRIISQENRGVATARNTGIDNCAPGGYIAFLDGDDLWQPEFLAEVVAFADSGHDFVYARTVSRFPDGHDEIFCTDRVVEGYLDAFLHVKNNELRFAFHISGILLCKEVLTKYGVRFDDGIAMGEDGGFYIKLLSVVPIACLNKVLTVYRQRESSVMHRPFTPELDEQSIVPFERGLEWIARYRPQMMPVYEKMCNYRYYQHVSLCLKNGYVAAAQEKIARYRPQLEAFVHSDAKLNNRLKLWAILRFAGNASLLQRIARL